MPLQFQQLPNAMLDLKTGFFYDPNVKNSNSTPATDPMASHKAEIDGLFKQEKPPKIEQVIKAIENYQDIPSEQKLPLIEFAKSIAPNPLKQLDKNPV